MQGKLKLPFLRTLRFKAFSLDVIKNVDLVAISKTCTRWLNSARTVYSALKCEMKPSELQNSGVEVDGIDLFTKKTFEPHLGEGVCLKKKQP